MATIGEEIARSVGNHFGIGDEYGSYVAGSVLLLAVLFAFASSWWLISRHSPPSWATTTLIVSVSIVIAWSGMWAWWIPAMLMLVLMLIWALRLSRAPKAEVVT